MQNNSSKKALVIGGIAIDDIFLPKKQLHNVVGGSAIYGSLAASIFAKTNLGGVLGKGFPEDFVTMLQEKGIDLSKVQTSEKPPLRWRANYSADLSEIHVTSNQMNAYEEFRMDNFEQLIDGCSAVFISNNDPELQLKIISKVPSHVIKIVDSMDIWMIEKRDVLTEVIRQADVFFLSEKEAPYLVENKTKMEVVDEVLSNGPRVLVLKKGEYGLTVYGAMGTVSLPSYPLARVVDPSGAGDSLGGAFAGILAKLNRLDHEAVATAALLGSVVASFVIEEYATEGLHDLTISEVLNRAKIFLSQLPNKESILLSEFVS